MQRTQVELAIDGEITPEMEQVAQSENIAADQLREDIAQGRIVIPLNRNRPVKPDLTRRHGVLDVREFLETLHGRHQVAGRFG